MAILTDAAKARLIADLPSFKDTSEKFFNKEISVNDYKGISGTFGSYAERGAKSAMFRLRLPGGRITADQLTFLAAAIEQHDLKAPHFTTGQSIQFHGLDGETVVKLFEECHSHGIYSRGGGGDYPSNIAASPLRGVTPGEPFDITPYVQAANEYILTLIPDFKLPRKFKMVFSNGLESDSHVDFKDFGFLAKADGTFTVFVGGGLGVKAFKGHVLAEGVDPADLLYYIKAMFRTYIENGDFQHRNANRTRFLVESMGIDKFRDAFNKSLTYAKRTENLHFELPYTTITKTGEMTLADAGLEGNPRVSSQSQTGLYAVAYHPLGGQVKPEIMTQVFRYVGSLEAGEARLTGTEGAYFINITADEAAKVIALTPDHQDSVFGQSVSCIGSARCQVGFQNSMGLLETIVAYLAEQGIDDKFLPRIHISGCPSSCGTHQIGSLGFHGGVKLVDKKPQPAFTLFRGGTDELGHVAFGEQVGNLTIVDIPKFVADLAMALNDAGQPFDTWIVDHVADFNSIVAKYL